MVSSSSPDNAATFSTCARTAGIGSVGAPPVSLVGCKLSLLLLCVHVEQRLQCGKIREHIDAGLGSFMTYVQVGRPEPPWHTEQVDPLDFLRVQLRLLGQEPEKAWRGH